MARQYDVEREIDAGLWEDWSEWASLDADDPASRYALIMPGKTRGGGVGAYYLFIPSSHTVTQLVCAIPRKVYTSDADTDLLDVAVTSRRHRVDCYPVAPQHWQQLRARLPAIKAAVTAYERKGRGDSARVGETLERQRRDAIAAVEPHIVRACDNVETIQAIISARRGKRVYELSAWEQSFADSVAERIERYGYRTRLSDKQIAMIDAIYRKIAHRPTV